MIPCKLGHCDHPLRWNEEMHEYIDGTTNGIHCGN